MKKRPDISVLLPDEAAIRARRQALTDQLQPSGPRRPRRKGRRARRLVVAVAALVAVGGGAAIAAGVFSADDIAIEGGVVCNDAPRLNANMAIFTAAADPVAKCARTWREGAMTGGDSTEVPHLVACAAENRPAMVFPGDDGLCERLGLEPLPSDYTAPGRAHARAFRALFLLQSREDPAPNSACPSPEAQAAFARDLLALTHPDVPVVVEGNEPCGGRYGLTGEDGERVAVLTVSRKRGRANLDARYRRRAMARVQVLLDPLFGSPPRFRRARERCLDPEEFAAEARSALARAGRQDIPVRIQGDGECVNLSARYGMCCVTRGDDDEIFVAVLRTMTRQEWRWSKREAKRWKKLREAADQAP